MIIKQLIFFLFWFSVGLILYVYIIYPILITVLAGFRKKIVNKSQIYPSVTLLIAAYNEEDVIREKIKNSLGLDYPNDKLEIAIVTDGSSDKTMEIVNEYRDRGVVLHNESVRKGKASAINRIVPRTRGEIILFSDADNLFRSDVIKKLVCNFSDSNVGAVSGKKLLFKTKSSLGKSETLYWRYESFIRQKESQFGSTTGVVGEMLAIRRGLFVSIPDSVINDDLFIAMQAVKQGYRVIYEPEAISEEMPGVSLRDELIRRSRISAGYYQLIGNVSLLIPRAPLFVFQVISHKLLRPFLPIFMMVALVTNFIIAINEFHWNSLMIILLIGQILFYFMAFSGFMLSKLDVRLRPFYIPYYFCTANFSYILGLFKFLFGRQNVLWEKTMRETKP